MLEFLVTVPPPKPPGLLSSQIGFVVVLILLALISGRLLGIRVSWPRGMVAAFIGIVAGFAVVYGQSVQSPTSPDFGFTFGIPAVLTTMLVLAAIEVAYRPGSVAAVPMGLTRPPRPIKALRRWFGRSGRYIEVLWIVARNGLNPYLRGRLESDLRAGQSNRVAVRLRRTLEECGGVFVKLGQVLSTRPDLLPPSAIAELSKLQDAVPPVPYIQLVPILETDLAATPAHVFGRFDEVPIAAASIAQVHRARLRSGEEVVVKVRRPGISSLVERDLDIIQHLTRAFAARASWARRAGVVDLADGFATAVWEETDFRIEAGNIKAIRTSGSDTVRIPSIFTELSTSRVLVMEWLDGVKLRDSLSLLSDLRIDRKEVARRLLHCVLRQIMVEGVFHADPHPGNVLILRDGTPALIDFGSVGRLDSAQQSALRRMLVGIDRRDTVLLRDALSELADIKDTRTQDLLERAMSQLLATRLGPGMQPGAELFSELLRMFVDFELALPGHVAAVFRCMVTLEGTLRLIAPGFAVVDESRAAAGDLLRDTLNAATIEQAARDEFVAQLPILRRLPRRLDQVAATIDDGRLTVRVNLFETERERQFVATMVGRAILAFLGATIVIASAMLESTAGGPSLAPGASLFHSLGYFGLLVSAVLILRVIVGVARDRVA